MSWLQRLSLHSLKANRLLLQRAVYSLSSEISEATQDIEEESVYDSLKDETPHKIEFNEWKKEVTNVLIKHTKGPVYFGGDRPFKYNPEFKVFLPLDDMARTSIYHVYLSDPVYWTPRRLANKFKISIERADAIIKLKTHEIQMIQHGHVVHKEYVQTMENVLGATGGHVATVIIKEMKKYIEKNEGGPPPIDTPSFNQPDLVKENEIVEKIYCKPTFITIPESYELTREQAAEIIQKKVVKLQDKWAERPILPYKGEDYEIIQHDETEKARRSFIFVDIGLEISPKERLILVRDPNGDLRHATELERENEGIRIWGKGYTKYIQDRKDGSSRPHPRPRILPVYKVAEDFSRFKFKKKKVSQTKDSSAG